MNKKDQQSILVTTAIEQTWGDPNENHIFLGEWCKRYSRRKIWSSLNHQTVNYHWRDRNKVHQDHDYLSSLYDRSIDFLTDLLNSYHHIDFSSQYWQKIVGPWLLTYIAVVWDRWETVRVLVNNHKDFYYYKYSRPFKSIPKDYADSIKFFGSDNWNETLFSSILMFYDIPHIDLENDEEINSQFSSRTSFLENIRTLIIRLLNFFMKSRKKLVIFHSYFTRFFFLSLRIKNKYLSTLNIYLNQKIRYSKESDRSKIQAVDKYFNPQNTFEEFLFKRILNDIPIAHIESFNKIRRISSQIPFANLIFTANAHFGNELFKVWSATNCELGAKLIISSHGGAIYPLFSVFDYQEKIADIRVIWGSSWMNNQVTLPPNKLSYKVRKVKTNGQVTIIDNDSLRYTYRCMSASQGPSVLESFKHTEHLANKLLRSSIRLKFRPKYSGDCETALMYEDKFGKDCLIPKNEKIRKTFKNSRLIICTYPQTAFSESMFSGVPTVLVYVDRIWETQPIYKDLLKELKDAKILHTNYSIAADHIKSIYDNTYDWWNSNEVIMARQHFNKMCITIQSNQLGLWNEFFHSTYEDSFKVND